MIYIELIIDSRDMIKVGNHINPPVTEAMISPFKVFNATIAPFFAPGVVLFTNIFGKRFSIISV